jgi:dolichyl-phosphate-mannose-protein mannosyltransferase
VQVTQRLFAICLGLFLISQLLFLINIQFPRGHDFDEFHYVPSAKQFLELKENQNWEHPPLGKLIMAVGIGIWGDRPIGWRYMSTVFGSLTLVGVYVWGLALFRNRRIALYAALITLFNQLLYVQARIGMLDTFMMGFMVWGLAAFTAAWDSKLKVIQVKKLFAVSGLMLGLAMACKWTAIIALVLCIGLYLVVRLFQLWGVSFTRPLATQKADPTVMQEWYSPGLWRGMHLRHLGLFLVVIPLAAYFATFFPFFLIHRSPPYTFFDILSMQPRMWSGQLRVLTNHPYNSQWTGWPLMLRPIWYAFDKEGSAQEWVRGVLLIGNPLVMWSGLAALCICAWAWIKNRSREGFLILILYCAFYFCWAVIPRKIAFYYYYYPAGIILSLAIAFALYYWDNLIGAPLKWIRGFYLLAVFILFVYFFPILSALRIPSDSFTRWMWFRSWI